AGGAAGASGLALAPRPFFGSAASAAGGGGRGGPGGLGAGFLALGTGPAFWGGKTRPGPRAPRGRTCRKAPTTFPVGARGSHSGEAEAAGGPIDDAAGVIEVAGVEVVDLPLRDLADLGRGDLEPLVLAAPLGLLLGGKHLAPLLLLDGDAGRLLEQDGRRR